MVLIEWPVLVLGRATTSRGRNNLRLRPESKGYNGPAYRAAKTSLLTGPGSE